MQCQLTVSMRSDIQFGEWKDGLRKSSYEQRFGRFRGNACLLQCRRLKILASIAFTNAIIWVKKICI